MVLNNFEESTGLGRDNLRSHQELVARMSLSELVDFFDFFEIESSVVLYHPECRLFLVWLFEERRHGFLNKVVTPREDVVIGVLKVLADVVLSSLDLHYLVPLIDVLIDEYSQPILIVTNQKDFVLSVDLLLELVVLLGLE